MSYLQKNRSYRTRGNNEKKIVLRLVVRVVGCFMSPIDFFVCARTIFFKDGYVLTY